MMAIISTRRILTIIAAFTLSVITLAQSPRLISYQAIIRNESNEPIADSDVNVVFTLHHETSDGQVVYSESHATTTNQFGLISLKIGAGSTTDDFASVDWGSGDFFLNLTVDGKDMGTTQVVSVPYAIYAEKAGNVFSGRYSDLISPPNMDLYITSESDPSFTSSPVATVTALNISNWTTAFGWGNHALQGYLTSGDESDPLFTASPSYGITAGDITLWNSAYSFDGQYSSLTGAPSNISYFTNDAGYITGYSETDPLFNASPAKNITALNITNWTSAFGWGNHALQGYLTNGDENDPLFTASPSSGITAGNISQWNSATSFDGQYSSLTGAPSNISYFTNDAGYITGYSETDPLFNGSPAKNITALNITNWTTAYGWGNHALQGYLKSGDETDPIFTSHAASAITSGNIADWTTAYGWGNHALQGYLKSGNESDPLFTASPSAGITAGNISQWNSATSFDGQYSSLTGAPANISYFTNDAGYITGYTEADPLFNASPAKNITALNITNWTTAYGWGNHALQGYLKSGDETDPIFTSHAASAITSGNIANWTTAYGWGDHSTMNYITDPDDADADNTNELQDLSLTANTLSLSNSLAEVDLSAFLDSEWTRSADSLYYLDGNVGVGTDNPRSTLSVYGTTPNDTAIFEVRNNNGQLVFAVYNDGVRINIDETIAKKGPRGGFAIGGFDNSKGTTEYMRVTGDSIRMYIDNSSIAKGPRGGFAIGGFDKISSKGTTSYMRINGRETLSSGYNTFLGYKAGGNYAGGESNIAIGYYSGFNLNLASSIAGRNNVFIGDSAGLINTSGYQNIYIGKNSGAAATSGYHNVYIGYKAGSKGHGQYNVMIGNEAGKMNNGGYGNVFMGDRAGTGITGGDRNVLIGSQAGQILGDGTDNVMMGSSVGFKAAGAMRNTIIGSNAGNSLIAGVDNVFMGYEAGLFTEGSGNIFIGRQAGKQVYDVSNKLIIDNVYASSVESHYINGDILADQLRFNTNIGVWANPEPGFALNVSGNIRALSVTQISDSRLKTDIGEINDPLSRVMALHGVTYRWKDPEKFDDDLHMGFIAQEVLDVLPEIVSLGSGFYSLNYSQVSALLVEAIKELKKENDDLKEKLNRVDNLESQLEELRILINQK